MVDRFHERRCTYSKKICSPGPVKNYVLFAHPPPFLPQFPAIASFLPPGFLQSSEALSVAVKVDGGAQEAAAAPQGFVEGLKGLIPSRSERKKLIPLAAMFFCILFNYTILRDTKVGRINKLRRELEAVVCLGMSFSMFVY